MVNCSYQTIPQFSVICNSKYLACNEDRKRAYFFALIRMYLMFMKVYREKLIEEAYGKHPKSLKKLQKSSRQVVC